MPTTLRKQNTFFIKIFLNRWNFGKEKSLFLKKKAVTLHLMNEAGEFILYVTTLFDKCYIMQKTLSPSS